MIQRVQIQTVVALLLFLFTIQPVSAQHIPQDQRHVYVQSDTLRLDARIDSLFTKRTLDAIESGMTASIAIQYRIITNQRETLAQRNILKRLEHDIWEGQYRLINQSTPPDTMLTSHFEDIQQKCSEIQGFALAILPLADIQLTLQARIDINPITPEQQERTRRWLKVLRKGSLIEFFFSLERPDPTPWVDLLTFRPNALPHLLQETQP